MKKTMTIILMIFLTTNIFAARYNPSAAYNNGYRSGYSDGKDDMRNDIMTVAFSAVAITVGILVINSLVSNSEPEYNSYYNKSIEEQKYEDWLNNRQNYR